MNGLKRKVRGGALYLAIAVSLLLMLSVGFFMLQKYFLSGYVANVSDISQLEDNIQSALTILENDPPAFNRDSLNLKFGTDDPTQTKVAIQKWGVYQVASIESKFRFQKVKRVAFFTDDLFSGDSIPSLYMADADRYLSIGGNTWIGSRTFLPGQGIRIGYLNGIGFYRKQLVQGTSFKAKNDLPAIRTSLLECFSAAKEGKSTSGRAIPFTELTAKKINNSFAETEILLYDQNPINLSGFTMKGRVRIVSGTRIILDKSTVVDNCILAAPEIVVGDGFKGRGQFYAWKKMSVGDSCSFAMPSLLFFSGPEDGAKVVIGAKTRFDGDIIVKLDHDSRTECLTIEQGSKICGQVYCNALAAFDGCLFGSFYVKGFVLRTSVAYDENYLLNVCIDSKRLPASYCGISLFKEPEMKKVVSFFE